MRWGPAALASLGTAAILVVVGHVDPNDDLDPLALTVSDFAVSDRGGVTDVAMGFAALATALVLIGLRRAGIHPGAWVTSLFAVWAGGLLLAAVVPTDEPGLPLSAAGQVHRYASVVAFVALPVGSWLLARRLPGPVARRLRWLAAGSLVFAGAMALSAGPGERVLIGLAERLLIGSEAAILAVLAMIRQRGRSLLPW